MSQRLMDDMIKSHKEYSDFKQNYFFDDVLFSFQWWFLVLLFIVLWIIWIILVDKKHFKSIILVGLTTSLLAFILDDIGLTLDFWAYSYQMTYFASQLYTVDLAIIPVFYMLLYQYARTWKIYSIILVLLTFFAVLVAEPVMIKLSIYNLLTWNIWYSAPFYILIGIFAKWFADWVDRKGE
ncbi:hypothetical protein CFK37_00305 [Virgibacillus phasianinus]|uniref:Uncharacterized protein n=1 Tax=Virgibacillus phasianinus TaxID=2017483 RepID=A0A220TY82_9BACI|nr:CBO0543 family protein [Virgibacillus phasianinus]ASK60757.1 hypothetical protein CFK37_00305 [Virgibacillus phasianinus]